MAKNIQFNAKNSRRKYHVYTDVEYVQGLLDDRNIQNNLYRHWREYFINHGRAEFFHIEECQDLIIHNAFTVLWEKVWTKKIYVKNGVLMGNDDKPFVGKLTTYLMSVAKYNNLELVRDIKKMTYLEDLKPRKSKADGEDDIDITNVIPSDVIDESPFLIPSEELVMRDILSEFIANMSGICNQILTMFYYKEMKLDSIMEELPSFTSKDALKTAKNKCMNKLKVEANKKYNDYLNS